MPVPPPVRNPSIAPLFMVTVMVVVIVAGAVSVVYLLASGRDSGPQPGTAAAAPPSAAPSASSRVDGCVVGEWQATSWRLVDTAKDTLLTTDNGGLLRLRADGTGEFDYGSGVTLKGKLHGVPSEMLVIGKVSVSYETDGQAFTSRVVVADARRVVFQSGKTVANELLADDGEASTDPYVCSGDNLRVTTSAGDEVEYRRK